MRVRDSAAWRTLLVAQALRPGKMAILSRTRPSGLGWFARPEGLVRRETALFPGLKAWATKRTFPCAAQSHTAIQCGPEIVPRKEDHHVASASWSFSCDRVARRADSARFRSPQRKQGPLACAAGCGTKAELR